MARRTPRYQREERPDADTPRRITADVTRHAPSNSFSGGPLFYEDREFTCIDCGTVEVWTAEDQKWWYEVAQGDIHTTARRCGDCRAELRRRHAGTPRRSRRDRREEADQE